MREASAVFDPAVARAAQGRLKSFLRSEDAQAATEYILIAAALTVAVYGAVKLFSGALAASFNKTSAARCGETGAMP